MKSWWMAMLWRAAVWAVIGGAFCACVGALLGGCVGVLIGGFIGAYIGAWVGIVAGGSLGVLIYFALNFFCAPSAVCYRPPCLRICFGMMLGVFIVCVWCFCGPLQVIFAPIAALLPRIPFVSGFDIVYAAPLAMLLGQIVGAVVTVRAERPESAESRRWRDILPAFGSQK